LQEKNSKNRGSSLKKQQKQHYKKDSKPYKFDTKKSKIETFELKQNPHNKVIT
jgi:hypothetical protein